MKKFKRTKKAKKAFKPAEEKKKRLSGPALFAIVVIAIMTISGIGFIWEGGAAFVYNEFKFKESREKFITEVDGKDVEFYIAPQQAEAINASKEAFWVVKNTKMAYMTSDYESRFKDSIARTEYELKKSLEKEGIYAVYAFTGENEFNITQITCENATISVPVIYFTNSTKTRIIYDSGCIIMESSYEVGFLALKDRLMYGFYGIIE